MKSFNEQRSTCKYREKQHCTYWTRKTQCHQLTCPIISQQFNEQLEPRIPRHIKESIDHFDRVRERIPPSDQEIPKTTQRSQDEGTQQKERLMKKTTTVITVTTTQKDPKVPQQYEESAEVINSNHDDAMESVDQDLTEPTNFSPTEGLQEQSQLIQETIIITPGQIKCDRCGNPINTETCTSICYPNGGLFYIHPKGQCRPRYDKLQEVRERWLKKLK